MSIFEYWSPRFKRSPHLDGEGGGGRMTELYVGRFWRVFHWGGGGGGGGGDILVAPQDNSSSPLFPPMNAV